jgi:hypothetical protein
MFKSNVFETAHHKKEYGKKTNNQYGDAIGIPQCF